jgi:four helix bundle protein
MRNFRNLKVWQNSMELVKEIYNLSKGLPNEEKYGLSTQITRAAVSIPSNIAEGCSRNRDKEYKRFLEISLGSSFELETQLLIIHTLNLGNEELIEPIIEKLHIEQKMLNRLINTIKASID